MSDVPWSSGPTPEEALSDGSSFPIEWVAPVFCKESRAARPDARPGSSASTSRPARTTGHASVQITMDRYSHLFDHAYSDVSDELEKAWTATETAAEMITTAVVSR